MTARLLWSLRKPHLPSLYQQVMIGKPPIDTDWGDHLPFEEAHKGRINALALNPNYTLSALQGKPLETITPEPRAAAEVVAGR